MTRVKLNLVSGSVQEREVVTAFISNGVKYIMFDGESNGSMGLPIILVSKENLGKVVGITDAEEWKNTKDCLKKIIAGETVEYAPVKGELSADDIYYRQLTLPIASFDILKSSYSAPSDSEPTQPEVNQTPIFEPITPEEVSGNSVPDLEPVAPTVFSSPASEVSTPVFSEPSVSFIQEPAASVFSQESAPAPVEETENHAPASEEDNKPQINYDELKNEFLAEAEKLFDKFFEKLNHED